MFLFLELIYWKFCISVTAHGIVYSVFGGDIHLVVTVAEPIKLELIRNSS